MLKIKDSIDLNELEKFGFVYEENTKIPANSVFNWNDMIKVEGNKEQIYIRAFKPRTIIVNSSCGIAIEKLYDLIEAGLVEKE